jgi:hypothetical protein
VIVVAVERCTIMSGITGIIGTIGAMTPEISFLDACLSEPMN